MFTGPIEDAVREYHVGILVPSSNTQLEPAIENIVRHVSASNGNSIKIYAHYTRIRVAQISLHESSNTQFGIENMLTAVSLLVDAGVDAIAWGGTSAGWLGIENDRALCAAITKRFGIPATTSTLALLEYMHTYSKDKKLALVTPFVQEVNDAICANFAKEGIMIVDDRCLSITDNQIIGRVTYQQIEQMLDDLESRNPGLKTIVVFCTNLHVTGEQAYGWETVKGYDTNVSATVIDSIAVTIWGLLGKVGMQIPGKSSTDVQRALANSEIGNMLSPMRSDSGDKCPIDG